MRVLAICLVIQFHVRVPSAPGWLPSIQNRLWFGMDLFFVLSGFLLGSILINQKEQSFRYFAKFYVRRGFRSFPQYFVVLLLAGLCTAPYGHFNVAGHWRELVFLTNYPYSSSYYMHWSWSLSLEEHFYIVSPILVAILVALRPRRAIALLALLFTVPLLLRLSCHPSGPLDFFKREYVPTHMRFDPLIGGVCVAFLERSYREKLGEFMRRPHVLSAAVALGLSLICAAGAFFPVYWVPGNFTYGAFAIGTMTTLGYVLLLFWGIHGEGPIHRLLGASLFRKVATLGYGIYLCHLLWIPRLEPLLPGGLPGWATLYIVTVFASVASAYALHLIVDKPMLWIRDRVAA
jgi:peptidoglycan/LPS O-acetylase OafA/YrhL